MSATGRGIRRTIKNYATSHTIVRFADRTTQTYDEWGDPVPLASTTGTINLHHQPIGAGKLLKDLKEGQRLEDMRKGWTLEEINYKDR